MILLTELISEIDKEMYKINSNSINEMQDKLRKTLSGDLISKKEFVENIKKLIPEFIDESDYINLIEQYHINYFEPIYTENNSNIEKILNRSIISRDADSNQLLDKLSQIVFQELYGLSVIDEYSYGDIKGLNEISCNESNYITMQIYGQKIRVSRLFFESEEIYKSIVKKSISFDAKRDLKPDCPEILCQRINGARVTALMPPYSKEYSLNIRYFDVELISSREFIKLGTSSEKLETFINNIMPGRPNIIVIGDQGTGKTTYILRLIGSIPDNVAIATMEPMFELNPDLYYPTKDIKKLQFLPGLKTPEETLETCLRLGRDLIINGEIRSCDEAVVQLKAWTRQGKGSIGSFHTSSVEDYIYDFKNLLMQKGDYTSEEAALYDIARATDIVIHIAINRKTGKRFIKETAEVILDKENKGKPFKINTLFRYSKESNEIDVVNKISHSLIESFCEYEFDENNLEKLKQIEVY